jgi:hypothetical protein
MPNVFQILRSAVSKRRPSDASRKAGELFVNFADRTLGVVDEQRKPMDLTAVPFHSPAATYVVGDLVRQGSAIYRCTTAVAVAAPFDPANWAEITTDPAVLAGMLPLSGGTMTGPLIAPKITAQGPSAEFDMLLTSGTGFARLASRAQDGGQTHPRWSMTLGGDEAETGQNVGRNFSIDAWADDGAFICRPVAITRASGNVYFNRTVYFDHGGAPGAASWIGNHLNATAPVNRLVHAAGNTGLPTLQVSAIPGMTGDIVQVTKGDGARCGGWTILGQCFGTGAFVDLSDRRSKRDIADAPHGLAEVMAVAPRTFTRNDGTRREIGFIAQEVQLAVPEAVLPHDPQQPDGLLGVETTPLLATLWRAVQQQQELITALTARIATLEGKAPT